MKTKDINYVELFNKELDAKARFLNNREIKILYLRYIDKLTLKQIGSYFNRSDTRIRAIIVNAERKLYRRYILNKLDYSEARIGYTF